MSDDYLFDKAGHPEPEILALEQALAPFRQRGEPPALAEPTFGSGPAGHGATPDRKHDARGDNRASQRRLAGGRRLLLAALVLALACGATWFTLGGGRAAPQRDAHYRLEALAGTPSVSGEAFSNGVLRPGDRVVCGPLTRARLHVGDIGKVELEPDSRLAVRDVGDLPHTDGAAYLLSLERGGMRASIFAPARLFQVGTPAGLAVDLGCVYEAHVADDGTTLLSVELGVVAFETEARKIVVPMGALARAHPGRGPGTPVWSDAPEEFRAAVRALDEGRGAPAELLELVLASETERDSLTLWHLLDLEDGALRARVFDRLAVLAPPPGGVTRAGVLAGDEAMRALWRRELSWDRGSF